MVFNAIYKFEFCNKYTKCTGEWNYTYDTLWIKMSAQIFKIYLEENAYDVCLMSFRITFKELETSIAVL